jgi:hypothetical protein
METLPCYYREITGNTHIEFEKNKMAITEVWVDGSSN